MPLGLAVLLVVLAVTVIAAALGIMIDKSDASRSVDDSGADNRR